MDIYKVCKLKSAEYVIYNSKDEIVARCNRNGIHCNDSYKNSKRIHA